MWRLRQKIHSQWRVALSCCGFVLGVASALLLQIPLWVGVVSFAAVVPCFWWARAYMLPFMVGLSLLVGLGYGSGAYGERHDYAQLIGHVITIKGRVKEDVGKTASGKLSIQLDQISIGDRVLPGSVLVSVSAVRSVKRGDRIAVEGLAKSGFGNFPLSVAGTAITEIIHPIPGDIGRVARDWFTDKVREVIPEPQVSLGVGFLTGQKTALPNSLADALKIAGLTHIVVASGYNLTILVQLSRKLFARASKFLSTVASSCLVVLFMAVTGLSPSMTRAGLVTSMSLLSGYYGHSFHPLVLLSLAAAITVAIQPSYVWGDLGWQLSFAAFAAVMLVAPTLQRYFFGEKEPRLLRQILGETIAAHSMTLPLIALSFGTVSNVAIIANLLVVPFVPLAMLLTFLCGLGAIVHVPFLFIISAPTTWLLDYMIQVASFVASLSWAQSSIEVSPWLWAVYAAALLGACLWMHHASAREARDEKMLLSVDAHEQYHGPSRQMYRQ